MITIHCSTKVSDLCEKTIDLDERLPLFATYKDLQDALTGSEWQAEKFDSWETPAAICPECLPDIIELIKSITLLSGTTFKIGSRFNAQAHPKADLFRSDSIYPVLIAPRANNSDLVSDLTIFGNEFMIISGRRL